MPRATLTFNLPEEQEEYECTMLAQKALSALSDFNSKLREHVKHREPNVDYKDADAAIEALTEEFRGFIEEHEIPWNKL